VAELHLLESGARVSYLHADAEELAQQQPSSFDVVACMEVLEHVPDAARQVDACARLLKPGGHAFFATINRNPKSFLLAIVGAEYVLGLLPRGTHEYARLIRPSELSSWCRRAGLSVATMIGMGYNPLTRVYSLSTDTSVNYIMHARAA
jgi:2-polyprenyl-6-hydroxyphenyl methylase/3-demethylubiquinone-9 3-methyltransferase